MRKRLRPYLEKRGCAGFGAASFVFGKCSGLLCVYGKNINMRYIFLLSLLMISTVHTKAQLGIGGAYLMQSAPHWELINPGASTPALQPPGTGYSIGLDYQFRLKKVRIEFAPELNYSHWSTPETTELETNSNWYSFLFNIRVYPFDLKGDCNCPTFSKRGNTFQKGFFVALSPGITQMNHNIPRGWGGVSFELKDQNWAPSGALVLGLDLGISELLTVTPHAGWRYFPKTEWPSLATVVAQSGYLDIDSEGPLHQFHAGLRLGWRIGRR